MAGGLVVPQGAAARASMYKGQGLHAYIIMVGLMAGCGGLLFGYDIGVSGGVSSMPEFQQKFFPDVYDHTQAAASGNSTTSPYCTYDNQLLQLFTSSLYLAGMVMSPIAALITRQYGRKITMLFASICFLVGAGLTSGAVALAMLVIGRIMLGFGIGAANQVIPLYLSETAPARYRGGLTMLFQLAVTVGIFVAALVNYGVNENDMNHGWRLSLGLAGVPAVILLIGSLVLPETPNSLIERGRTDEGRRILAKLRGISEEDVQVEFEDIMEASAVANQYTTRQSYAALFSRRNRPQLIVTSAIAGLQQLTGINAIMFYVPVIFSSLGSTHSAALLNTVVINSVNLACTFVAIAATDRFGRRILFMEGGAQMIITLFAAGGILCAEFKHHTSLPNSAAIGLLVVICFYVAGFSWSWGPLGWCVPSEIQSLECRAAGMATAVVVNFLFTFFIGQAFLSMMCGMEYGTFFFFAGWVILMTIFIYFCLPETKGVPIEEVHLTFARHWLWSRVMGPHAEQILAASAKRDAAIVGSFTEAGAAGAVHKDSNKTDEL